MKNILLTIAVIFTGYSLQAQQAILNFEAGTSSEVYITSIDSIYITTSKGRFALDDIKEAIFPERKGRNEHIYYEMANADVVVKFDENVIITELKPPYPETPIGQLDKYKDSMREFKKYHQIGTGLQLSGILLGLIGVLSDNNGFIYAGMGVVSGGLILELKASNNIP